jgi:phosphoserine phosphatase
MRVFDFDNTIYDGESSVDFFKYFLVRYPHKVIKYVPTFIRGVVRYKLGKLSIDDLFSECSKMFRECCEAFDNIPEKIERFWDRHEKDVKPAFRDMLLPDDVILSASPEVVLKEICKRMGVKNVIGSDLGIETGEVRSICYRDNKIKCFRAVYGDIQIDEFYTDSEMDKPFMEISDNVFFVKGDKITKIKENGVWLVDADKI